MYLLYLNFQMWPRFKFWHFAEKFQQQLVKTRWCFGLQFNPYQSAGQSSFLPVNTDFLITLTDHRTSKRFFSGGVPEFMLQPNEHDLMLLHAKWLLPHSSWVWGRAPVRSLGSVFQSSVTLTPLHLDSSVSPEIHFDDLPTLHDLTFCYF